MNGDVYGGGVELALSCDFPYRGGGLPHARSGRRDRAVLSPCLAFGRFVGSLGLNVAKRILVASEQFESAAPCWEIGFLDQLVAA